MEGDGRMSGRLVGGGMSGRIGDGFEGEVCVLPLWWSVDGCEVVDGSGRGCEAEQGNLFGHRHLNISQAFSK